MQDDWAYGVKLKTFTPKRPPTEKDGPEILEVWNLAVDSLGLENIYALDTRKKVRKIMGDRGYEKKRVPLFRVVVVKGHGWPLTWGGLDHVKLELTHEKVLAWLEDKQEDAIHEVEDKVKELAEAYASREVLMKVRLPSSKTLVCEECGEDFLRKTVDVVVGVTTKHCSTECATASKILS